MKVVVRLLGFGLLALALAATYYLGRPAATAFHATRLELVMSVLLLGATVITAAASFSRVVGLRIAIAAATFLGADALLVSRALDRWPLSGDLFHSQRYVVFLIAVVSATIYGLLRRRLWARWIGLAFGTFGALSSSINAYHCLRDADHYLWTYLVFTIGSLLVGVLLADPDTTDAFLARHAQASLWRSRDWLVRLTHLTIMASYATVSMLLVYAWMQPFVPSTARSAEFLAATLAIGATLTALRKVAGALILGMGGMGLAAQCVLTMTRGAAEPQLVAYYLVFWAPTAVLGVTCCAAMLWRARRLVG
jgi:hypothetical protein